MFCPTCGRDNLLERKFCAASGTNLEAVSQALSGDRTNFFNEGRPRSDHARFNEPMTCRNQLVISKEGRPYKFIIFTLLTSRIHGG